jgi:hypothetical protein
MLKLRRADQCLVCASDVPAGELAWWDATKRTVTCTACRSSAETGADETLPVSLDPGRAGASAAREHDRRRRNREARTRDAHPRIGGLLLALQDPPQHEIAFRQGAVGEQEVADSLERRTGSGPAILLHDRRMPGGHGNIDHIAVAPTGVFVIDAKNLTGDVRVAAPLFGRQKLLVGGRDRTKLVDGLDRQVSAVRDALTASGQSVIGVRGVLCFTKADLPLLRTVKMRGHLLLYRKSLAKRLNRDGSLGPTAIEAVADALAAAFPAA